ncbi:MAG: site-2 protease family protein [Gammaproteobacteria bacterium]|nr:MAG: site-2 protease family protein [Gammaproteobacteria bacterium]
MDLAKFLHILSFAAIPVLFAITLHEVAHGWVARWFGDRTAEMQGRLSLNPLRHIDPIGTVLVPALLLLLGGPLFGWAKPVPVDPRNLRKPRQNMAVVAAAGPTANFAMAVFWALVMVVARTLDAGVVAHWLLLMGAYGITINLLLALLNLLPIPPLDGGQLLRNLLPEGPATALLDRIQPFGFIIVLVLIATGTLFQLIGGPMQFLQGLLQAVFGVRGL